MQRRHPDECDISKSVRRRVGGGREISVLMNSKTVSWNKPLCEICHFSHDCIKYNFSFFLCVFPDLQSDSEKKSQIESLKLEISSLKEQVVQQQQALQAKIVQVDKPGD